MIALGPYRFTTSDALRTMANLGGLWSTMAEGRDSTTADELVDRLTDRLRVALGQPTGTTLSVLGTTAATTLAESPLLVEVLRDAWDTLAAGATAYRRDGQMPPTGTGTVTQLSLSKGGVPKLPVPSVEVGFRGVVGDVQRVRIHHGRPWQALCLYADEVIEKLQADGHPIGRGCVGENITIRGLDWTQMRPGVRIQVGTVQALVQAYAEPCATNKQFFVGGDFHAMNKNRGPLSRIYATVLEPGHITTGDAIILEP